MNILPRLIFCVCLQTACSQSNTQSEWSCPTTTPDKCYDVGLGDQTALDALRQNSPLPRARITRAESGTISTPVPEAAERVIVSSPAVRPVPQEVQGGAGGPQAVRIAEELAEIWIAPFVDKSGHWHNGSYIFVQLRPPRWAVR